MRLTLFFQFAFLSNLILFLGYSALPLREAKSEIANSSAPLRLLLLFSISLLLAALGKVGTVLFQQIGLVWLLPVFFIGLLHPLLQMALKKWPIFYLYEIEISILSFGLALFLTKQDLGWLDLLFAVLSACLGWFLVWSILSAIEARLQLSLGYTVSKKVNLQNKGGAKGKGSEKSSQLSYIAALGSTKGLPSLLISAGLLAMLILALARFFTIQ